MELSAREDIEAPLDRVFAQLTDFEAIERRALRRGVEIQRTDNLAGPAAGMSWKATFRFRGKTRTADVTLSDFTPPEQLVFDSVTGGLETHTRIECVALSRGRTRISIVTVLQPKTLSARLLVQSLKLAKSSISRKFSNRMAVLAKDLEDRLRSTA
ncbi:MAG: SRPBCC family protein [Paracoccaceae bacterium]|nr:SRPBCC family protein [Paracoccaceae bacterium]